MASEIPDSLRRRWQSGLHLGDFRPSARVQVEPGYIQRAYADFAPVEGSAEYFGYIYGGAFNSAPWQGTWTSNADREEVPNVRSIQIEHSFDNNGVLSAAIEIDNVALTNEDGYHAIRRGYYAPWLGYNAYGRPHWSDMNEWFDVFNGGYRVRVEQGYGEDSDDRIRTFEGLIDETDTSNFPDSVVITCRNFGSLLTDQRIFADNKPPELKSPITFCDRQVALARAAAGQQITGWILIDDPADMVKWACMWCGFKEWDIEPLGVPMKNPKSFAQSEYFIDIINYVKQQANYTFYVKASQAEDEQALGVPVFKRSKITEMEEEVEEVTEDDLLTDMTTKFVKETLFESATFRGKAPSVPVPLATPQTTGETLSEGEETTNRARGAVAGGLPPTWGTTPTLPPPQAAYYPPWSKNRSSKGRTAGLHRHIAKVDRNLETYEECLMAGILTAFEAARVAFTGTIEIPALPSIDLDDHLSVIDSVSGANSRLWVSRWRSNMSLGTRGEWVMSIDGALLDFPDLEALIGDYQGVLSALESARALQAGQPGTGGTMNPWDPNGSVGGGYGPRPDLIPGTNWPYGRG